MIRVGRRVGRLDGDGRVGEEEGERVGAEIGDPDRLRGAGPGAARAAPAVARGGDADPGRRGDRLGAGGDFRRAVGGRRGANDKPIILGDEGEGVGDESIDAEALDLERRRAEAICGIADRIQSTYDVVARAVSAAERAGIPVRRPPLLGLIDEDGE